MTRNEVILGAATLALVAFSLLVALVVPRHRPDFPGPRVGLFVLVALLFVAGMLATVEAFGGEEGREDVAAAENGVTQVEDSGEPDEEGGGETGQTEPAGGGGEGGGDAARGEAVFAEAGCGSCHVLEAAGSSGTVGPNLDEQQPSAEAIVEQVTNGGNGMPAFGDRLSPEDIEAVAAFIVQSTGG